MLSLRSSIDKLESLKITLKYKLLYMSLLLSAQACTRPCLSRHTCLARLDKMPRRYSNIHESHVSTVGSKVTAPYHVLHAPARVPAEIDTV